MKIEEGIEHLARAGLNLFAVLDCASLPDKITSMMVDSGVALAGYERLVLVGHGGRRLWERLQSWGMETADPVDHFSTEHTRRFIHDYLDNPPVFWLYPDTPYMIPLQQLGELAGWSYPSPLGSGISPQYGVWFAYRAAFLTTAELPIMINDPAPSPCRSCAEKPCMTTCPVGAVQVEVFGINACVSYRLSESSSCSDRCLARMACPYFPEHQYTLEQIQYHYNHSLTTLRAWYNSESR